MSHRQTVNPEVELGSAPLMPLIAKYAIPSIISMLVGALYNLTDQIFIGRIVGVVGNAASNVVFPTTTFSTSICMLLGIGTAAGFNIAQGAGKIDEAKKYVYTGLSVTAIFAFLTGLLVFIFRGQIIDLCGASPTGNVYPYAMQYLSISAIGLPFYIFASAAATTIRADGSPRYSMLFNVVGAVLNVGLDWLFMYPFGWGIQGAAAATVISQIVTFVLAVLYFTKFNAFKIRLKDITISKHHMFDSMKAGLPSFVNQILLMTICHRRVVLRNAADVPEGNRLYFRNRLGFVLRICREISQNLHDVCVLPEHPAGDGHLFLGHRQPETGTFGLFVATRPVPHPASHHSAEILWHPRHPRRQPDIRHSGIYHLGDDGVGQL